MNMTRFALISIMLGSAVVTYSANVQGQEPRANRLAESSSPYLQLHAHNPVDWYPWGPAALAKARREEKLIFLSVGYFSCHWCHVMERESFTDDEIAALLNQHFVCIKVDREERPDIDAIYMTALQAYHRAQGRAAGGGWPMSMFLLPDTRPFFGGTYFPARDGDRGAGMGFLTLIEKIQELWSTRPESLRRDAETLTRILQNEMAQPGAAGNEIPDQRLPQRAVQLLDDRFDPEYGGFSYSVANPNLPKFPEPPNLLFLLDQAAREDTPEAIRGRAREMAVTTLERMALGGIRDHWGGGFHRYSVDRYWGIPHFEKMLYDQGQLATVYAEAYALTGDENFRRILLELIDFVERELAAPAGGFYAALDAESEGEEGKFYRWQVPQIESLLGPDEFARLAAIYGLDKPPNFEEMYFVPQLKESLDSAAAARGLSGSALDQQLEPLRARLLAARDTRPRPATDTKILTSWNGLMIRGLADAGRILDEPRYREMAARTAEFVLDKLRTDEGRLLRTYSEGQASLNAYLDDYAFLVDGLIALHRATGESRWLDAADDLTRTQLELFWDDDKGGFFFTSDDHESLIARARDPADGVEPAGNSVAADNLLYLGAALGNQDYIQRVEQTLQSVAGLLQVAPHVSPRLLMVLQRRALAASDP